MDENRAHRRRRGRRRASAGHAGPKQPAHGAYPAVSVGGELERPGVEPVAVASHLGGDEPLGRSLGFASRGGRAPNRGHDHRTSATELAQADAIVSDLDEAAALILTLDTG